MSDAYLAEKLQITEGDEEYEIRSLYYADGVPYSLNTAVLPAERFPKLDFLTLIIVHYMKSLVPSFIRKCTRYVRRWKQLRQIKRSHRCWNGKRSQPLLKIKAVSYSLEENREITVEYYEAYILTEIQNYYVEKFTV